MATACTTLPDSPRATWTTPPERTLARMDALQYQRNFAGRWVALGTRNRKRGASANASAMTSAAEGI